MSDGANQSEKPLLIAQGLCKRFGGLQAVDHADIVVNSGSITGLIGPNGAGKTTLFNLLSNFIRPDHGQVLFNDHPISQLPCHKIALQGCVRTFQVAKVLSRLTVLENMLLADQQQTGEKFLQRLINAKQVRQEERTNRERALIMLDSVGLLAKANDYAGALSGGQRKLLEMARALMSNPKLILLDEPAAGVNPTLIGQILNTLLTGINKGLAF
jgi:neutral amino acid transport system ATP-binding protein